MNQQPAQIYVVAYDAPLRFKQWDEECVVFNCLSGETLLLETTSASLVQSLSNASLTYDQLLKQLKETFTTMPEKALRDYLTATLEHLSNIGLVSSREA